MKMAKEATKSVFRGCNDIGSQDVQNDKRAKPVTQGALQPVIKSIIKFNNNSAKSSRPGKNCTSENRDSLSSEEGKRNLERQYYSADVSAMIDGEKYDHQAYIYGYKVSTCHAWLHGKCSKEDSECFDSHCNPPLRRKPHLQHGRFNYIPTRCRYLTEKEECPQTIHCRFAHCTEEVIYHPSKFRTQLCQNGLDSKGICEGYGYHCAKAHSEVDLRPAVFETMDNPACLYMTMDELSDFVCATKDQKEERQFYMYVYKTRKCEGYPYNCGCDGLDYHRGHERRRSTVIKYLPMACPNIKPFPKSEWGDPYDDSKCVPVNKAKQERKITKEGAMNGEEEIWDCQYAHTLMEVMYHPQVYKTDLCQHFDEYDPENWRCVWKKRCAHAHGRADLRTKEEAVIEWKAHMGDTVKGRKLPSLVEQLLSASSLDKNPSGLLNTNELTKAFSEEFSLRGLEDRKNYQMTPAMRSHSARAADTHHKAFDYSNTCSNNISTDNSANTDTPLHNLHVRQSQRNAPRRNSLPLLTSALSHQHSSQSHQQMMDSKRNSDNQNKMLPPPPLKQQLPPIPPQQAERQTPSSSSSRLETPKQQKQDEFPHKSPPPTPLRPQQSPKYPPPPPPTPIFGPIATSDSLASRMYNTCTQIAPSDMLFPRRRSLPVLDVADENPEPPIKTPKPEDLWKTPKPIESQRPASPKQKWMPLFDLGASTWSSPGSSPELPRFRALSDEGGLLTGLRPEDRKTTAEAKATQGKHIKDMVKELENSLECPFEDLKPLHLMFEPVTTPCCGLSFCRTCTELYLAAVDGRTGWPLKCVELKDKYPSPMSAEYTQRESGRCICGHFVNLGEFNLMTRVGRSNFTVDSVLEITRRYSQ